MSFRLFLEMNDSNINKELETTPDIDFSIGSTDFPVVFLKNDETDSINRKNLAGRCSNPQRIQTETENSNPVQWDQASQNLIDWFMTTPRIKDPFRLDQHRKVCVPEKFYDSLMQEIQTGPSCPRNRNGAVIDDLKKLKTAIDGYNTDRSNEGTGDA